MQSAEDNIEMIKMSISQIAGATRGELIRVTTGDTVTGGKSLGIASDDSSTADITDASTDSRDVTKGSLFVALKGPTFDGHDFLDDVLSKGVDAVCISNRDKLPVGNYIAILVEDTLKAYQDIASWQRNESDYIVIGVTGSVGKTSTRQMIVAALSDSLQVHSTRENYNNEIGLPRTIIEAGIETEVCVLEMGMRGVGEIRQLAMIARPDIAVITNIGMAHIERLNSRENIFEAKKEIVEGLTKSGLVILNAEDPYLKAYCNDIFSKHRTCAIVLNETPDLKADLVIRACNIEYSNNSMQFDIVIQPFKGSKRTIEKIFIPLAGEHNILNALIAIATAIELDINLAVAINGLRQYQNIGNRQRVVINDSITIIDDTYNCAPESMDAAIKMLTRLGADKRKIAVLGGMLELGDFSDAEHIKVGQKCYEAGIDIVFSYGEQARQIIKGIEMAIDTQENDPDNKTFKIDYYHFDDQQALIDKLCTEIKSDDIILVKGSRGFKMENVTKALENMNMKGNNK